MPQLIQLPRDIREQHYLCSLVLTFTHRNKKEASQLLQKNLCPAAAVVLDLEASTSRLSFQILPGTECSYKK